MKNDSTLYEEWRDKRIAELSERIAEEIRCKLRAGDQEALREVDEGIGAAFFEDGLPFRLLREEAKGERAFGKLMDRVVSGIAEIRAIKELERIERMARDEADWHEFDLRRSERIADAMIRSNAFSRKKA